MIGHLPSWIVISAGAVADISYSALIPAVVSTTLALVAVVLRLYSRARLSRKIGTEDILVAAALSLSVANLGMIGAEFSIDANHVTPETRRPLLETMMKLVYTQSMTYQLAVNLVKISLLNQYRNLFRRISRTIVWSCNILFVLIGIATSWGVGGVVFLCRPVQKYWKGELPGTCMNAEYHFWSTALVGITLDVAIWVLPMPAMGKLRIGGRQRGWLFGVFGLGAFICLVSVLRLVVVHDAAEKGNVTKSGTHVLIWSTVEVNTAIICASLLVMKPLFQRIIPSLITDSKPTTAREDANDFCMVLKDVGLHGPERDPWAWRRDGNRGRRVEQSLRQGSRVGADGSSDSSSDNDDEVERGEGRKWGGGIRALSRG